VTVFVCLCSFYLCGFIRFRFIYTDV